MIATFYLISLSHSASPDRLLERSVPDRWSWWVNETHQAVQLSAGGVSTIVVGW